MVLNTSTFLFLFLLSIRHLDLFFWGHTTNRCWAFFDLMALSIYVLVSPSPFLDSIFSIDDSSQPGSLPTGLFWPLLELLYVLA